MLTRLLRLSLVVNLFVLLTMVAARHVGAQRPRDWLALDARRAGETRSVYVVDVPLRVMFNTARLLGAAANGCSLSVPAWSKDARLAMVVFCDYRDILIMDLHTAQITYLTDDPALDDYPTWSNDGHIAFVSDRDATSRLYIGDPTTGEITWASEGYARMRPAVWSNDGKLAFLGYRTTGVGGGVDIYVRDVDGSVRRVTSGLPSPLPSWSPDSKHLVYAVRARSIGSLLVVDAAGGEPHGLTNRETGVTYPLWLADGRLSFIGSEGRQTDIYLMDMDTGLTTNITNDEADNSVPSWSRDHQRLAYLAFVGDNADMYLLDVPTGALTRLSYQLQVYGPAVWAH